MLNEKRSSMLHGILLIALFSLAAFYLGDMTWATQLSISPMIIGILLGMLYANSLRNNLPETWVPGITFCAKRILRIGIILYGFRLTLQDVTAVGMPAIVADAIIVCTTVLGGIGLGRLLRLDRSIALLTSVGSAICGAAAVLGTEGAIHAKPYKTAVRIDSGYLRNAVYVSLPCTLSQRLLRTDTRRDGHHDGVYSARGGTRSRSGQRDG